MMMLSKRLPIHGYMVEEREITDGNRERGGGGGGTDWTGQETGRDEKARARQQAGQGKIKEFRESGEERDTAREASEKVLSPSRSQSVPVSRIFGLRPEMGKIFPGIFLVVTLKYYSE